MCNSRTQDACNGRRGSAAVDADTGLRRYTARVTPHRFTRPLIVALIESLAALPAAAQPSASPQAAKLRQAMDPGKRTQVTNDGVEIQALTNGNIENRKLAFGDISSLKTGQRKSGFAAALSPVLTMTSLLGTAAAITAAIRK